MNKAIIFDMDGTIWNSLDEIEKSWNLVYKSFPDANIQITKDDILDLMGLTMDMFAKTLLPHLPFERACQIMHECEIAENNYIRENGTKLYGDVGLVFDKLHQAGFKVMIVSNCQAGYIEAFLDYFKVGDKVDATLCYGDTGVGKADNLKTIISRNSIDNAWYVGDTQSDYDACKEAGIPFIFAAYGFGHVEDDVLRIDKFEDILELASILY